MCGIAGALSAGNTAAIRPDVLRRMLTLLRHRGPEVAGVYHQGPVALGHARLSIIDVEGGLQPLTNEDGTVWAIVNGEVFNYVELRAELRARGHQFRTGSDSEVILHLYEEIGPELLDLLNGQFAFALWDARRQRLLLARDRLGVRPLFYTMAEGTLLFASEIKALLADPHVSRHVDLRSLDQVFTYWSALPGRTMFEGIYEVPSGHYMIVHPGTGPSKVRPYWRHHFAMVPERELDEETYSAQLRELLIDATRLRLRADVPVGAYLSGGLDSSAISAIVRRYTTNTLQTFSVAFADKTYDERLFQERMAQRLDTQHHIIECRSEDIAAIFPEVIWHAETPVLRTAPAPLFMLSELVRRHGLKVVLTGEGADEFLAGYPIFKEALVRRFWARQPQSQLRPLLLRRLYSWIPEFDRGPQAYLEAFFKQGMTETDDPTYSHALRWRSTARLKRFFSAEVNDALAGYDSRPELHALLHPDLKWWHPLSQAQHIEARTFLTPYLLSTQGDRMAMAHSVEGRFPFLDHRLVEFAGTIPPRLRMRGLHEKRILRKAIGDLLPEEIRQRAKQPYRAPIGDVFCSADAPEYVGHLLSPETVQRDGYFNPAAVQHLLAKGRSSPALSESDSMALVGILSTQLWHTQFVTSFRGDSIRERMDVIDVSGSHATGWRPPQQSNRAS